MSSCQTTNQADEDIIEIYIRGVQDFGVSAAELYLEKLRTTFELLADFPKMSRLWKEFRPPLRAHPCGSNMIFYSEVQNGVLILRVLGGSQDWQRHFDFE